MLHLGQSPRSSPASSLAPPRPPYSSHTQDISPTITPATSKAVPTPEFCPAGHVEELARETQKACCLQGCITISVNFIGCNANRMFGCAIHTEVRRLRKLSGASLVCAEAAFSDNFQARFAHDLRVWILQARPAHPKKSALLRGRYAGVLACYYPLVIVYNIAPADAHPRQQS